MSDPERPQGLQPDDDEALRLARRRLMKLAAYTAPALIGLFSLDRAEAQASCGPNNPCMPDGGACGPDSGCMPGT